MILNLAVFLHPISFLTFCHSTLCYSEWDHPSLQIINLQNYTEMTYTPLPNCQKPAKMIYTTYFMIIISYGTRVIQSAHAFYLCYIMAVQRYIILTYNSLTGLCFVELKNEVNEVRISSIHKHYYSCSAILLGLLICFIINMYIRHISKINSLTELYVFSQLKKEVNEVSILQV